MSVFSRYLHWKILAGLALVCVEVSSGYLDASEIVVLGVAQDGGYPQAGCSRDCCESVWENVSERRFVSCLAVVDTEARARYLFDCTPDFKEQLRMLDRMVPSRDAKVLDGVFPTHAHVGHYAGLIHLGREAIGARGIRVFAMPRMKYFLESNGPWSQLVRLEQIRIHRLAAGESQQLSDRLSVTPFLVPHRDEYSETVGFLIQGPRKSAMYLPDIDKWERWDVPVESMLAKVDVAFLDGTFFSAQELPGRNMAEIPHPFIQESVQRFAELPLEERRKIHFIHLNHSNPLLRSRESAIGLWRESGMHIAKQGMRFGL